MYPKHNTYHPEENLASSVGYDLEGHTVFFSDSTPSSVATKVEETIDMLPQESAFEFFNFCVLAAVYGERHILDLYLADVDCFSFSNFIRQHWMNRNRTINMSILSLAGHCIMAATGTYSNNVTVMAFRSRIRANHIWDANLRNANVSREKRRVSEEKKDLHGKGEAIAAGRRIIAALVRRQRQQGTQTGRRSHSRRGSARLGYNLSPVPPKPKQEWNRKDDLQCEKYEQTGYTADDDNKMPAQTEPNMHITNKLREIQGRSYFYYKHACSLVSTSVTDSEHALDCCHRSLELYQRKLRILNKTHS